MKSKLKNGMGILMISLSVLVVGCTGKKQKDNKTKQEQMTEKVYTCPMHPEVEKSEPGNCPKCGMKLIEKGAKMKHQMDDHNM